MKVSTLINILIEVKIKFINLDDKPSGSILYCELLGNDLIFGAEVGNERTEYWIVNLTPANPTIDDI